MDRLGVQVRSVVQCFGCRSAVLVFRTGICRKCVTPLDELAIPHSSAVYRDCADCLGTRGNGDCTSIRRQRRDGGGLETWLSIDCRGLDLSAVIGLPKREHFAIQLVNQRSDFTCRNAKLV